MNEENVAATLTIGNRRLGCGSAVYVIAELSGNHNQEFDQAARLVRAAPIPPSR